VGQIADAMGLACGRLGKMRLGEEYGLVILLLHALKKYRQSPVLCKFSELTWTDLAVCILLFL
jgi:hypothetical protein